MFNSVQTRESYSLKELSLSYIDTCAKITRLELENSSDELNSLYQRQDETEAKLSKWFAKYSDGLIDLYAAYIAKTINSDCIKSYAFIRNDALYLHSFIILKDKFVVLTKFEDSYYINTFAKMPVLDSFDIGVYFNCLHFDSDISSLNIIKQCEYDNYKLKIQLQPYVDIANLTAFAYSLSNCISHVSIDGLNIILNLPKILSYKSIDFLQRVLHLPCTITFKIKQDFKILS